MPKIDPETIGEIQSVHSVKRPGHTNRHTHPDTPGPPACPGLAFYMHLFGVEARGTGRNARGVGGSGGLEGSFSCPQPAGGNGKRGGRVEGDEERRGEEEVRREQGRRAVAGISSPESQLITQRLPKNILEHRAVPLPLPLPLQRQTTAPVVGCTNPAPPPRTRMFYQSHRFCKV